jgi:branched-chain amino acid transport system substrate-binding protein
LFVLNPLSSRDQIAGNGIPQERALALFEPVRLIAPTVLAATLLVSCGGTLGRDPIRIGVAGSFTDPIGLPMKLAAELAIEEINSGGGIGGRRLELVARDDYADPDSAVFVANDLYESGVSAVIGHLFSGMTLAAAPVYNGGAEPVAAISPSSSSPEVTTAGEYTFRVCPSDLAHGAALAHWVRDRLKLQRGALFYLNDQYGRGIRQTFVQEFIRQGGELTSIDPYLGDRPEVGAYLDRIARDKRVEFLIVAGNRSEAEEIIRQARRRGLAVPVLGGDGLEGIQEAGALAEGVYLTSSYFPNLRTEANQRFVEAYRKKYPSAGFPNQVAAATYDAVYLLREVFARAGSDRESVRQALAGVGSATPPFEGVTGTVAFDAAGDVPNQNVYVGLVRHGDVEVENGATEMAQAK